MQDFEEWLKQAETDFGNAKKNFDIGLYGVAAFLLQQALEKALKALYIKKFEDLDRSHDLHKLAEKVDIPENLIEICDEISPFYVETRYPDTYAEFDEEKVSAAIEKAEKVLKWAREKI